MLVGLLLGAYSVSVIAQEVNTQQLEAKLKTLKNTAQKVDVLNKLAEGYKNQKALKKGQNYANQAISLAKKINYKLGLAEAYHQQGALYANRKNFKEALNYFQKALPLFEQNKAALKTAILLNKIGGVYYYLKEFDQAIQYISKSAQKYDSLKLYKDAVQLKAYVGIVYVEKRDYPNALKYYNQALESYRKNKQKVEEANILVNIAVVYFQQKKVDQSIKSLKSSLQLFDELKMKPQKGNVSERIGDNYLALKNYEQAIQYFKQALKIYEEENQKELAIRLNKQLAALYYNQQKYEQARQMNQKIVDYLETQKDEKRLVTEWTNLGILYRVTGKYDKALEYYKKSLELRKKLNDKSAVAAIMVNIGEAYALQKNLGESIKAYSQSLKIREELKDTTNIVAVLEQFARLYNEVKEHRRVGGILEKAYKIRKIQLDNGSFSSKDIMGLMRDISSAYYKADKFDKVFFYENELLKMHQQRKDEPNIAQTLLNLGICSEQMNRNSEAIDFYEQAQQKFQILGEKAASAKALYNSAKLYQKMKNDLLAIQKMKQSLLIREELQEKEAVKIIADEIGHLYSAREQYKEALVYFKKADNYVEKPENEKKILQSILICHYNLQQYEEALKVINELLELESNNVTFLNKKGLVLGKMKKHKEAVQVFSKAAKQGEITANFNRAWAYIQMQDYPKAIADYDTCLLVVQNIADLYAYRGFAHTKAKQLDKAKADLEKASSLEIKNNFVYLSWAAYFLAKEQKNEAVEYLKKAKKFKLSDTEKETLQQDAAFASIRKNKAYKDLVRD
ncbi:hypothetical protein BKI52_04760 [marine bacterium AO1-C]|nr:hypothetical protein BKI52_04760 [marine bacterium AO1-C]